VQPDKELTLLKSDNQNMMKRIQELMEELAEGGDERDALEEQLQTLNQRIAELTSTTEIPVQARLHLKQMLLEWVAMLVKGDEKEKTLFEVYTKMLDMSEKEKKEMLAHLEKIRPKKKKGFF
jgi:septal ring factor EnvC (AmiA/AmiB activator)